MEGCLKQHGVRPVKYLERLGFLGPHLIACHCIWLDEEEMDLLKAYEVKLVHNPVSNMKLAVEGVFPYPELRERGLTICLGTDGCASNNNLDMLETAKFASLLQKFHSHSQVALPAHEALEMLTSQGAQAFRSGLWPHRRGEMGRYRPGGPEPSRSWYPISTPTQT